MSWFILWVVPPGTVRARPLSPTAAMRITRVLATVVVTLGAVGAALEPVFEAETLTACTPT